MKREKILLGTGIFAALLMAGSFYKLLGFTDYHYYQFMFQYLPDNSILFRYAGSIALRIFGILIALGLLLRIDRARQIFLVLSICSVLITPWKHPYRVFENIAIFTEHQMGEVEYPEGTLLLGSGYPKFPENLQGFELKSPSFPKISLGFHALIDFIFYLSGLIYFTRPRVKASFIPSKKEEGSSGG